METNLHCQFKLQKKAFEMMKISMEKIKGKDATF